MSVKLHTANKRFIAAVEKYNIAKAEMLEAEIDVLDEMFKSRPKALKKIMFYRNEQQKELEETREEIRCAKENKKIKEAEQQKLFAMLDEIVEQIQGEEDDEQH